MRVLHSSSVVKQCVMAVAREIVAKAVSGGIPHLILSQYVAFGSNWSENKWRAHGLVAIADKHPLSIGCFVIAFKTFLPSPILLPSSDNIYILSYRR